MQVRGELIPLACPVHMSSVSGARSSSLTPLKIRPLPVGPAENEVGTPRHAYAWTGGGLGRAWPVGYNAAVDRRGVPGGCAKI